MKVQLAAACFLALVIVQVGATTSPLEDMKYNFLALSALASSVSVYQSRLLVVFHHLHYILVKYDLNDATKFQAMCTVLRRVRSNQCNETDNLDQIRNITCSYVSDMWVSRRVELMRSSEYIMHACILHVKMSPFAL